MFYFGYGIAFYGAGWWTSRIDFAGNVVIFGVHNSSSSHSENHNFGNFGSPEKKLVLSLVKQIQNFVWVYITIMIIFINLLMERKSARLKLAIKKLTFQISFA